MPGCSAVLLALATTLARRGGPACRLEPDPESAVRCSDRSGGAFGRDRLASAALPAEGGVRLGFVSGSSASPHKPGPSISLCVRLSTCRYSG